MLFPKVSEEYHFVAYLQLAVVAAAADASPTGTRQTLVIQSTPVLIYQPAETENVSNRRTGSGLNPTWSRDLGTRKYSTTTYCYYDANGRKTCETKKGALGTEGYSTTPAPATTVQTTTKNYDNNNNNQGCLQSGLRGLGLNRLVGLIERAGIADDLGGDSELTLFAPTDAALQASLGSLPRPAETVKRLLLNHVINGAVKAGDLSNGASVTNQAGNSMTVRLNPVTTVGGARVSRTDLSVCRLTVHTLDGVIDPANLPDGVQAVGANHHYN